MKLCSKITIGVFTGAISCIAVYYTALFVLPDFADLNKYKGSIIESVEKETGFKISCEDISFQKTFTPCLKIHLHHTLILYPDNTVFLQLKETDLSVKILPLLLKKIEIADIKLTRPIINYTLYKDFSTSIEKYINFDKVVNTNGFKFIISDAEILCNNYKIKIQDETVKKLFYAEGEKLLLNEFIPNEKVHIVTAGSLFQDNKEYIKYDIDLISFLDRQHFTFSPFKTIYNSDINANITAHLKAPQKNNVTGELKINDLKLKADNIILDNNSVNLVFKGQKLELDSILHTSKDDTAKIKGEYTFGKNKYINLNANAKNIKLDNLHKIISEISEMLNISSPVNEIKMKGLVNADFNIQSDFKTLTSNGQAKIIDAEVKHKSLPYSLTNINSEINFNDNKVIIEQAQALFDKTPVTITGEINKNIEYNIFAKSENLDFVNVVKLFNLDKNSTFKPENGKLSFEANIKGISGKKYTGNILINNLETTINKQHIKAETLKFLFDENNITIPVNTISSPVPLKFSGKITNYNKKPLYLINFDGKIPSQILSGILKQYISIPNKALGFIDTAGIITAAGETLNIKSQLKADGKNYISFAVIKELLNKNSIVNIDCGIANNNVTIKDLSLYENTRKTQGGIIPVDKLKKIISVTGEIENIKTAALKNVKISIPEYISSASSFAGGEEFTLKTELTLNNKLSSPKIQGTAKINKLNIKKYLTSIKNADINFSNDEIRIIAPDVTVNNSMFNISANIIPPYDSKNMVVSDLMAHCTNLDLNTLFPFLQQSKMENSKIEVQKGSITVNSLYLLDLKAHDLSANMNVKNGIITISDIMASAYGGSAAGEMEYNLSSKQLKSKAKGRNIDIKTSLFDLCKLDDNLSGSTDFDAEFSLITGEYKNVLNSLRGNVDFKAKNGKMGTLGKFEYYLYAQNILYHGLLNTTINRIADMLKHDNTTQYREANGNITFENGYITTENITTTGTNMSLYIRGRHNMLSNQANIDIYGRISDDINTKLGNFANYSISDFLTTSQDKKEIIVLKVKNEIMEKIPLLYDNSSAKTNTFKVNVYGNIKNPSSINSFMWIIPDNINSEEILPEFSDLTNETI